MKYVKSYWKSILCIIFIFSLSALPHNDIPRTKLDDVPEFDKFVHFCMYLAVTYLLLFDNRFQSHNEFLKRNALIVSISFSIVYGGLLEATQSFVTTSRAFNIYDFLANVVGIIAAIILYPVFSAILLKLKFLNFKN